MASLRDESWLWLCLWTVNNLGVTLLNKITFAMVDFQYPYFLSFVHMLCNSLGTQYIFWQIKHDDKTGTESSIQKLLGHLVRRDLDATGKSYILLFSLIFSLNIAIGNVSLRYVSVNFNQVMRSLVPCFTIFLGLLVGKTFTCRRIASVVPIIVGVMMACFGDMEYTILGFVYTLSCVILAALKAVVAGEMLTGSLKLHPVDLLGHLAPLAMIQCIIMSLATGEIPAILRRPELYLTDPRPVIVILFSGLCSFSLNITSLMTNKLTSPLTLTIAGNVKQVMMIVISTIIFATPITPLNGFGIVVVLIGSAIYSFVSLKDKKDDSASIVLRKTSMEPDDKTNIPVKVQNTGNCRDVKPPILTSRSNSRESGV
ncbi:triose-phosphate transporter family protein [Nitzschia inconspicua]|uniref:Triose-phosphate transporter family protein n=1 Tax=Nitzschia inconspicua TaxID=303405 RepID=A0A9K3LN26_9STRA|nr:triose-phosphate transporter family protein [Nitzschia inconspicua]